jgi:membrane associated rhomboid family serine protease
MLDLNRLLLLIAVATPLAILARTWRARRQQRGWRLAALAVLFVAALSWLLFRQNAGYIAGGAWLALLFIPAIGMRRVADLAQRNRFRKARRLASLLRILHPSADLHHEIELLRMYEARPDLSTYSIRSHSREDVGGRLRRAPAVLAIILLNAFAFAVEIMRSRSYDWFGLHRLGALEPVAVIYRHQYWRLLTALFLHAGVVHLLVNLFALWVLGPALERAIGTIRFCICYLFAGLGSGIGVIILSQLRIVPADQLVGASGSIMGVVGAWGAYLLRHRHMPLAKERLFNLAMIVALQTVFDWTTPQVSMPAHLCGLASGFLVGLALAPRGKRLVT